MYFPNAFRKSFLPASTTPITASSASTALTAGQLGFFTPTSASNSALVSTVTASVKPFFLIQGSYFSSDKIGAHGGYKESIKSKLINPKYISRVITVAGKSPLQHVVKVTVSSGLKADSTYRLRLDVKGSPALRFLNHQLYRTLDAFTGCADATNPTYVKDPVSALLLWKDQINSYPTFTEMVKARVYKYAAAQSATSAVTATVSQVTIPMTTTTGIVVGQKAVGTGIPANAFVTTVTASTSIVVKYPTQNVAPTIAANVAVKFWSDVYSEAGTVALIPGTSVATGLTSAAYSPAADAATITYTAGQEPHLELTAGYVETKFESATFTPTDKFDIEPLMIYAAVVDESGDPCQVSEFVANSGATAPYLSSHAFEVQAPVQVQGIGETVLRQLILDGRYSQNAYPDSGRVDSLRMREIEADPKLVELSSIANRNALYDQVMVLHNVPRWNNPSSTFDNDQYLIVLYVPKGTSVSTLTSFFVDSANAAQGANTIAVEAY
jgi:hypothetical protein